MIGDFKLNFLKNNLSKEYSCFVKDLLSKGIKNSKFINEPKNFKSINDVVLEINKISQEIEKTLIKVVNYEQKIQVLNQSQLNESLSDKEHLKNELTKKNYIEKMRTEEDIYLLNVKRREFLFKNISKNNLNTFNSLNKCIESEQKQIYNLNYEIKLLKDNLSNLSVSKNKGSKKLFNKKAANYKSKIDDLSIKQGNLRESCTALIAEREKLLNNLI